MGLQQSAEALTQRSLSPDCIGQCGEACLPIDLHTDQQCKVVCAGFAAYAQRIKACYQILL